MDVVVCIWVNYTDQLLKPEVFSGLINPNFLQQWEHCLVRIFLLRKLVSDVPYRDDDDRIISYLLTGLNTSLQKQLITGYGLKCDYGDPGML